MACDEGVDEEESAEVPRRVERPRRDLAESLRWIWASSRVFLEQGIAYTVKTFMNERSRQVGVMTGEWFRIRWVQDTLVTARLVASVLMAPFVLGLKRCAGTWQRELCGQSNHDGIGNKHLVSPGGSNTLPRWISWKELDILEPNSGHLDPQCCSHC